MKKLLFVACAVGALNVLAAVHVFPENGWAGATVAREKSGIFVRDAKGANLLRFDVTGEMQDLLRVTVEPDGVVVDTTEVKKAAKGREVTIIANGPKLVAPDLQGEECRFRLAMSSKDNMAKGRAYIIGERLDEAGKPQWMAYGPSNHSIFRIVSAERCEYDIAINGACMPERSGKYRWRFDFREANAPVKFYGARIAPYAELKVPVPPVRPVKAELLFRATFDKGTAEADFAAGGKTPVTARGLAFADGRNGGKAIRIDPAAKPFLAYPGASNMAAGRGSVVVWFKNCIKAGDREAGAFQFASGAPFVFATDCDFEKRIGKGFPYFWFWRGTLRFDWSPDGDGYTECSLGVTDPNWHCVVGVWNEYGATWFKDGRPAPGSVAPIYAALAFRGRTTYTLAKEPETFTLGSQVDGSGVLDCLIDDVRIYSDALTADEVKALWREDKGEEPPAPDYKALLSKENRYEGGVAKVAGRLDPSDLELLEEIKLDKIPSGEFNAVGKVTIQELGGVKYLEAENVQNCRFALGLKLTDAPLHYVEIDYPDDCERTMEFILQPAKDEGQDYAMQVGVATGRDAEGVGYTPSGRIQTHRCILWTKNPHVALVAMTWLKGARGVAVSAVRTYRVKSGRLPVARIEETPGAPQRQFGVHYEDCPLGSCFAAPNDGKDPAGFIDGVERLAATMKFTGQNLFSFPGAFYRGPDDTALGGRHPPHFMDGLMTVFDREGLGFMASINTYALPIEQGLVTPESLRDGSLLGSFLSAPAKGWPGAGSCKFNIAHPKTQAFFADVDDRLLAEGVKHPSFRGIALHLTQPSACWFGAPDSGFNDYCIDAFEKRWNVKVPVDRADPRRAGKYAAWLRANAWEKWRAWKCETVGGFWIAQAKKLAAARPDLKLRFIFNTCEGPVAEHYLKDDYPTWVHLDGGLDPDMISKACANVVFAEGFCPADYRHGLCGMPLDRSPEGKRQLAVRYAKKGFYESLENVPSKGAHQHDRYWESNIGNSRVVGPNGSKPLSCDWMTEHNWRVSTINPSGRDALRHFTMPLRFLDLDNMTKGGFLIGTYGMEEQIAPFAEYFRAMPAVPFETLCDERGVVIRRAVRDGVTYLYVANTTDVERKVAVPFVPGMRDVVTGETFEGPKNLVLPRWQLRSFRTK